MSERSEGNTCITPRRSPKSPRNAINNYGRMYSCLFSFAFVGCDFGDLGGGVRVRTRNALHEVGAQSLEKRVTARLAQGYAGSQKLRHIVRTTTSHFLFINTFLISILYFINIMHLLRFYKNHQKHA